jgi:hypothetical protein
MGVGAAPAESPPVLRGPREVFAGNPRPIQITGAASDPILLADAHGGLALPPRVGTSRPRLAIAARHRGSPSPPGIAARHRGSPSPPGIAARHRGSPSRLAIATRHRGSHRGPPSRLDCCEPSHRWDEAFTARR